MLYEASSFFPENIEPVYEAGLLRLIESDRQLGDSATLKLYDGHTPGQIVPFLDDDGEQIIFPPMWCPLRHTSLGWLSAYDNNAALAMEEKNVFWTRLKSVMPRLSSFTMPTPGWSR